MMYPRRRKQSTAIEPPKETHVRVVDGRVVRDRLECAECGVITRDWYRVCDYNVPPRVLCAARCYPLWVKDPYGAKPNRVSDSSESA